MKLMKFTLVYVIALVILSVNGVLSKPRRKRAPGPPGVGKVGKVGPPGVGKVVPPGPIGPPGPPGSGPVGPVGPTDYCDGKTRSDGTQNPKGSCSTFIQGDIPSSDKMPSSLIVNPQNGGSVAANQAFTVDLVLANIETGQFSDPATQYNSIPQSLNGDGFILGHTHVTIQGLSSDSTPPDSSQFAFFKGVNDKADPQGKISVNVVDEQGKAGLPSGNYRICTMTSSFSHQPAVMPVAKRGSQDDCIRITVQ